VDYLYHVKKMIDFLLNNREQNGDVMNFGRHGRGLSLKKQSKKML
jgi:hypothetical protein